MLRTYPEDLLDYAVDGVVQAVSAGQAADHQRLQAAARARAQQDRKHAQAQAQALRADALAAGYQQGMLQAITQLLPLIEALQCEQQRLIDVVRQQLHARLQAMTVDPDVLVPQWSAACERWVAGIANAAVLHVPEDQPALLQALTTALADTHVTVQPAPRQTPALHVGELVYSLDMQTPLKDTVDQTLQRQLPHLQPRLAALATAYCDALQASLAHTHHRRRLAALDTPHDH